MLKNVLKWAFLLLIAHFFFACSKSTVDDLGWTVIEDSLMIDESTNVRITYTDSGRLKAVLTAPTMYRNNDKENSYIEMPNGVEGDFFNEEKEKQSSLTALYAISYDNRDLIYIRDSVVIHNIKDEEIRTPELYWDKVERRVYSDKKVQIKIRDEKILYGTGFDSNETFTKYTIHNLTGVVYLKEE